MPTQERLRELYVYDYQKGLLLRKECWLCGSHNVPIYGKHGDGYLTCSVDGKSCLMHRMVWVFLNGEIPKHLELDHINGSRTDNRIENLRLVNRGMNARNSARRSDNRSGTTGVYWDTKHKKWGAEIYVGGKTLYLGHFDDIKDAVRKRKDSEVIHGFHKNHGRSPATVNEKCSLT